MKITDCKYAHRINPLGCDAQPVFSWLVQDGQTVEKLGKVLTAI